MIFKSQTLLEISLILSLFLGFLYTIVWLKNQDNKEHFWFGLIYWVYTCFAVTRLLQFQDLGAYNYTLLPKLVVTSLILLLWLSHKFVYSLARQRLSPLLNRLFIIALFLFLAVLWSTDWVLTQQPLERTSITNETFTGVVTGVAYPYLIFFILIFVFFLYLEISKMTALVKIERQILGLGFALVLLMGLNDAMITAFNLKWVRLFDMAYLPMGFLYTFVQFNRYSRLHRSLESEVNRTTKDLREANKRLLYTESRYREIFEKGSDWIYIHDLNGNIQEENFRFKKDFSKKLSESGYLNINDLVVDEYKSRVDDYLNEIVTTGYAKGMISLQADENEAVVLDYRSILLTDDQNRPIEIRGTARDITSEVKALKDKKGLEDSLRQSQKMESIGTLAGGVAHDFNNVLSMILGNSELALSELKPDHPMVEYLKEIKSAGLRATGIIKQLLNFSRKANIDLKPVDAVLTIKDALHLLRSGIPSTIEINRHLPSFPVTILGDAIQLNRVLINLCTNAS